MSTVNENSLHARLCRKYAAENRIFSILIEITHQCPCHCEHCFLLKKPGPELTLPELADLFAQLSAEGVIELALSGGELFTREDFPEILELAAEKNFFLNVLTTGIFIDKPEIELFKKTGVRKIELSLLGACAATHDGIMQYPGAFKRLMHAVQLLTAAGILVALKATIMEKNWKELEEMSALTQKLGAYFSASLAIVPRENHDTKIQRLAVTEESAAALNMKLIDGALIPLEEQNKHANLICRAGCTIAGIASNGDVFPCILLRKRVGNIRELTIQSIWHTNPDSFLQSLRELKTENIQACINCELKTYCSRCPGIVYMETGSLLAAAPSLCRLAKFVAKKSN